MNTIGFDDAPFERDYRGDVTVVGVVCARARVDGIVTTRVRRDGANATDRLAETVETSGFKKHLNAVLLQGIAVGGFNVIDIHTLHARLGLPVLVVARRRGHADCFARSGGAAASGGGGARAAAGAVGGSRRRLAGDLSR